MNGVEEGGALPQAAAEDMSWGGGQLGMDSNIGVGLQDMLANSTLHNFEVKRQDSASMSSVELEVIFV